MEQNKSEEIEGIKKKVTKHSESERLEINRVPKPTLEIFKEYSNKECAGDYGMALKSFVDMFFRDDPVTQEIVRTLQEHEDRLAGLENKPKSKKLKTLSGKEIEYGGKENGKNRLR
jgi:hypothetical protein